MVVRTHRQGFDRQLTQYDDRSWRDVLSDRQGALADERNRHRVGAHAVARDAAGGKVQPPTDLSYLLHALAAFLQEHRGCGELDGGVEDERVWMTCTCGAVISQTLESARCQQPPRRPIREPGHAGRGGC